MQQGIIPAIEYSMILLQDTGNRYPAFFGASILLSSGAIIYFRNYYRSGVSIKRKEDRKYAQEISAGIGIKRKEDRKYAQEIPAGIGIKRKEDRNYAQEIPAGIGTKRKQDRNYAQNIPPRVGIKR